MTPCRIVAVTLAALLAPLALRAQDPPYPSPQDQPPAPIVRSTSSIDPSFDTSQQEQIQPAQATPDDPNAPDPALANLAVASGSVLAPHAANSLPVDPALPAAAQLQSDGSYQQPDATPADDTTPDAEADQPPPDLFDYDQPFAPAPFFLWIPGYWAHNRLGFFWVPGQWSRAPYYGALWTPPYWGFSSGHYRFHPGYWGTHIGYYGGVNYGFGYIGVGFFGGYWSGQQFFYNTAIARVPSTITTVYNHTTVFHGVSYSANPGVRTGYNGGPAGLHVRPRAFEIAAAREPHLPETAGQVNMRRLYSRLPLAAFSQNQGRPTHAAIVPHTPVLRPGMVRPTLLPAESLQDAQRLEARRTEALQRMRQDVEARRAAGLPVNSTGATALGPMPGYTSAGRVPRDSTSTSSSDSAPTPPAYRRTETAAPPDPALSSQPVSTVRREPSAEPAQTIPDEPRRETQPASTEIIENHEAHETQPAAIETRREPEPVPVEPHHEEPAPHSAEPHTGPPPAPRHAPPPLPPKSPSH